MKAVWSLWAALLSRHEHNIWGKFQGLFTEQPSFENERHRKPGSGLQRKLLSKVSYLFTWPHITPGTQLCASDRCFRTENGCKITSAAAWVLLWTGELSCFGIFRQSLRRRIQLTFRLGIQPVIPRPSLTFAGLQGATTLASDLAEIGCPMRPGIRPLPPELPFPGRSGPGSGFMPCLEKLSLRRKAAVSVDGWRIIQILGHPCGRHRDHETELFRES